MKPITLTAVLGLAACVAAPGAEKLAGAALEAQLTSFVDDIAAWALTLDVRSGALKNTTDTPWSIFINGNLARLLLAASEITGKAAYREEALAWCDTFCQQQQLVITSSGEEGGYWADAGKTGNIYFGDAGTAATALAMGYHYASPGRQRIYRAALERWVRFARSGSIGDPQDRGRQASRGFILRDGPDQGALGCGYYRGHLSLHPYTISTATTLGAAFSHLYGITGDASLRRDAAAAVRWLFRTRAPEGYFPYIIDGQSSVHWPLATITYCSEGFIGAYTHLGEPALEKLIRTEIKPVVEWLLRTQTIEGVWDKLRSDDQQRSPGVVTLLSWYYRSVEPDGRVAEAVRKYFRYLLVPENATAYGVKSLVRTSGFAGLAAAELIRPGVTFRVSSRSRTRP